MSAVRIGRKRANDGLSVHLEIDGETCNTTRPVLVETTRNSPKTKRCHSCFTPARIAIAMEIIGNAAQTEAAAEGANYSAERLAHINTVGEFIQPTKELDVNGFNPEYDEERAAIAARHAAYWADETPAVKAPRTAFAEAAERMGAKRRQLPTNVTPISRRKRLALAASFAA